MNVINIGAIGNRNLFDDDIITCGEHNDGICNIAFNEKVITIEGQKDILLKSMKNFNDIKRIARGKALEKYLPQSIELIEKDNNFKLEIKLVNRAIPLSKISDLEQKHANWILSRMLEFSAMLSKSNYVHMGINPDSIYVVPKTHGIIPITFYHCKKLGQEINNELSDKYYAYYPNYFVSNNKASYYIDVELCKKTIASCMKGNLSLAMKKEYHPEFVDFILNFDKDTPDKIYFKYRTILDSNFKKEFHEFNI